MENCSGWNMISIRNPGGGKSILFCKLFVPVWKPSVSVFMKGCDNSTVVTSTLIESTGKKKEARNANKNKDTKKYRKTVSLVGSIQKYYPSHYLDVSTEETLMQVKRMGLLICFLRGFCASASIVYLRLIYLYHLVWRWQFANWYHWTSWWGSYERLFSRGLRRQKWCARSASKLSQMSLKKIVIRLHTNTRSIKMSANCIDYNRQLEAKANSWPLKKTFITLRMNLTEVFYGTC